MEALILAGGLPTPKDPLYSLTHGRPKALLHLGGKPLLQWVLDAVSVANEVDRAVIIGLEDHADLIFEKPLFFLPDRGSLIANMRAGMQSVLARDPGAESMISISADVPALQGEMLDWVVRISRDRPFDLTYLVIERAVMEQRFPGVKRTYLRLREGAYCGADVMVLRSSLLRSDAALWSRLFESRKIPLRQALILGLDFFLLALTRRLSLQAAAARLSRRLGIRGQALPCPYPEMGMDVDKPEHLEILQRAMSV